MLLPLYIRHHVILGRHTSENQTLSILVRRSCTARRLKSLTTTLHYTLDRSQIPYAMTMPSFSILTCSTYTPPPDRRLQPVLLDPDEPRHGHEDEMPPAFELRG